MNKIKILRTCDYKVLVKLGKYDPLSYYFKGDSADQIFYDTFKNVYCNNFTHALNTICEKMNWKFIQITSGTDASGFSCHFLFFEELPQEKEQFIN